MKRDKLYTANKWNKPQFAKNVDRDNKNIFDGLTGSMIQRPGIIPVFDASGLSAYQYNNPNMGYMYYKPMTLNTPQLPPHLTNSDWYKRAQAMQPLTVATSALYPQIDSWRKDGWGEAADTVSSDSKGFNWGKAGNIAAGVGASVAAIPMFNDPYKEDKKTDFYDMADPTYHLAGGRESAVGNTFGTVGKGLFQAGASTGNPWLMAAGAGAKIIGGLTNAAFGVKWNDKNIKTVENNIAGMRQAGQGFNRLSTNSDLANAMSNTNMGFNFSNSYIGKNGWFNSKATKKANKLRAEQGAAQAFAKHAFADAASQLDTRNDDMAQLNTAAYGGFLDNLTNNNGMDAINYGFLSDYLMTKDKQNAAKDKMAMGNLPLTMFAKGGKIKIKHPGRLTELKKRTGKTEAELWAEGRPDVRKMITFARNARKWKKAYGGFLDAQKNLFALGGPDDPPYGVEVPDATRVAVPGDVGYRVMPTLDVVRAGAKKDQPVPSAVPRWVSPDWIDQLTPERAEWRVPINPSTGERGQYGDYVERLPHSGTVNMVLTPEEVDRLSKEEIRRRERIKKKKKGFGGNLFALGGDTQMHGADYSTGLLHVDAGGTHEENPNEGVQLGVDNEGTPNMLEEGETVFNDYVFSDRIKMDDKAKARFHISKKKEISYAAFSKKLEREIVERPNDPISKAALKKQLEKLQEEQERQKQEMQAREAREAFESLSPEEQVAAIQQLQAQQQGQEQAMQEQAMAEQEAAAQQQAMQEQMMAQQGYGSPEEEAMMQQQMMAQQGAPMMQGGYAYGGRINRFDGGGTFGFDPSKYSQYNWDWDALIKAIKDGSIGTSYPSSYGSMQEYENSPDYKAFTEMLEDFAQHWGGQTLPFYHYPEGWNKEMREKWNKEGKKVLSSREGWSKEHPLEDNILRYLDAIIDTVPTTSRRFPGSSPIFIGRDNQDRKIVHPQALDLIGEWRNDGRWGAMHAMPSIISEATATQTPASASPSATSSATPAQRSLSQDDMDTLKKALWTSVGVHTQDEWDKWAKEHNVTLGDNFKWSDALNNESLRFALAANNPALQHALGAGYDYGVFKPTASTGEINFLDSDGKSYMNVGNWAGANDKQHPSKTWNGSGDRMYKEAIELLKQRDPDNWQSVWDNLDRKGLEDLFKETQAYKDTTAWMTDKEHGVDNMLAYLNALSKDPEFTTPSAIKHLERFVDRNTGKWKEGVDTYDVSALYSQIFGEQSGNAGRIFYPGNYWHTPSILNNPRGAKTLNYVVNDDGSVSLIETDVPKEWKLGSTYSWQNPTDDLTYNYYTRPDYKGTAFGAIASGAAAAEKAGAKGGANPVDANGNHKWLPKPVLRDERWRYLGLAGPAIGLGLWGAGVGRPDTSGYDAALARMDKLALADWVPIHERLKYQPYDVWSQQNRQNATSAATNRYLTNNSGSLGQKAAGLLANEYQNRLASGALGIQAQQYNDQLNQAVQKFNQSTSLANQAAYDQTSQFNANAMNQHRNILAQMSMDAATRKAAIDRDWYNGLYGNISGLFKGLGDLGRENAQRNMLARMAANGIFGPMSPSTYISDGFINWYQNPDYKDNSAACGGKISKKKNKRRGGLTY